MKSQSKLYMMCGDSFRLMESIRPNSVDTIITDPPYGTTRLSWDHAIDLERWWELVERVIKPNGTVITFSQQPFTTRMINSNRMNFRYELIWKKTSPVGFLDAKIRPLRAHENILVFCNQYRGKNNRLLGTYNPQMTPGKPYTRKASDGQSSEHYGKVKGRTEIINEGWRYPIDVLEFSNRAGKSYHPTQKPTALMDWLVLTYSNPGDRVLDPFMGSGSTGVSSVRHNRNFFGIEKEEKYFDISCARIQAEMKEACDAECYSKTMFFPGLPQARRAWSLPGT